MSKIALTQSKFKSHLSAIALKPRHTIDIGELNSSIEYAIENGEFTSCTYRYIEIETPQQFRTID